MRRTEKIVKIIQKIMMATLITSALAGSVYAVYDPDRQDETRVGDLPDIGLVRHKLSITRSGIDAVLDDRFDPARGYNEAAKNAKAFLHGIVHGTIDRFDGPDVATKKDAFLAA
ncbi:MAG: hypothetical protein EBT45_06325 [Alphaproteobacteria bacterium]|jgi:hypothetical protein|nr:hypothetical protein [Alphaproteobacteria bacterium]